MYKLAILLMIALSANAYHLHWQVYLESHIQPRRVANASGDKLVSGGNAVLQDKRGGLNAQSFCVVTVDANATQFMLRLCYAQQFCLNQSGGKVVLGKCDANAILTYDAKNSVVKNKQGKCMDCSGKSGAANTQLLWYTCNNNTNQKWRFAKIYKGANQYLQPASIFAQSARIKRPVMAGELYVQTMLNGHRVFNARDPTIKHKALIELWDRHGSGNQRWCMQTLTGNKFKLFFCDKPQWCAVNSGDWFTLDKCSADTWLTYDAKTMTIKGKDGKCVDVNRGWTTNGSNIYWYKCDGQTKQKFRFMRAAEYINLNQMLLARYKELAAVRAAAALRARLIKQKLDAKKRHTAERAAYFKSLNNTGSCGTVAYNGRCGKYGVGGKRCSWGYCSRWSWCGAGTDYIRGGQTAYNSKAGCRTAKSIADLKKKWDAAHPAPKRA